MSNLGNTKPKRLTKRERERLEEMERRQEEEHRKNERENVYRNANIKYGLKPAILAFDPLDKSNIAGNWNREMVDTYPHLIKKNND